MREKIVEFAYPSSPHAVEFGWPISGCYVLEVIGEGKANKVHGGYPSLTQAREAGNKLPEPWHPAMKEGWRCPK